MLSNVSIRLVYEPTGGTPLTVARVAEPKLLRDVAAAAIEDAEDKARQIAAADGVLGTMELEEVSRLRRVLALLVPGMEVARPAHSPVM